MNMEKSKTMSMEKSKLQKFPELKNVRVMDKNIELDLLNKKFWRIYRYTSYKYAQKMIAQNKITLVSPEKWEDPFEKRFFNGDYSKRQFLPGPLACGCFTTEHGINEAAAWKFYSSDNMGVQLTFDFKKLLQSLDEFADKIGALVFVKKADYQYEKKELESSGKNSFLKNVNLSRFNHEEYIKLLGLKRRAFAFENELRIIVYGENVKLKNGLLEIPMKEKTICTLKVNPQFSTKIDLEKNVQKYGVRVEHSRLYDKADQFKLP